MIVPSVSLVIFELFCPNIPVEFFPAKLIVFLFVTVEASPAIPTTCSLVPSISPLFVTVELAAPYIPVEYSVPNVIFPALSLVPSEALKAIPTRPSVSVAGVTPWVFITPVLLTSEPVFPIIPAVFIALRIIPPVVPVPVFVTLAFSANIPAELSLLTLIKPLFVTSELSLAPPLFSA